MSVCVCGGGGGGGGWGDSTACFDLLLVLHSGLHILWCLTVWIYIRSYIVLVLICVQTVCKDYKQIIAGKELIYLVGTIVR